MSNDCDCFLCKNKLLEYYESNAIIDEETPHLTHSHTCKPKEYIGFTDRYFYCEDCGKKIKEKKNE